MSPHAGMIAACPCTWQRLPSQGPFLFCLGPLLDRCSICFFFDITPEALGKPAKQNILKAVKTKLDKKVYDYVCCENRAVVSEICVLMQRCSAHTHKFSMLICQLTADNKCSEIPMSATVPQYNGYITRVRHC